MIDLPAHRAPEEGNTTMTALTPAEADARVKRGAALLDACPDLDTYAQDWLTWQDRIDHETLDVVSYDACVLAQLFGSYDAGLAALHLVTEANDHGFCATYDEDPKCRETTAAWMRYLGR